MQVRVLPRAPSLTARDGVDVALTHDTLNAIWIGDSLVVAVGKNGRIVERVDGVWSSASWSPETLYGVWGASDEDVWAVGAKGTILRRNAGSRPRRCTRRPGDSP